MIPEFDAKSDLVRDIAKLIDAASKPMVIKHPGGLKAVVDSHGEVTSLHAPRRSYRAHSISGLVSMLHDLSESEDAGNIRVFVSDRTVTALLDEDGDRIETIVLDLCRTRGFDRLSNYGTAFFKLDQSELDWILRSEFPSAVDPSTFVNALRKLKFARNSEGTSEVTHGRESMGVQVDQKVSGLSKGDLPEEITLSTTVFEMLAADDELEEPFQVKCAVRINVEERTFTIRPLEGELKRAEREATEWIADQIDHAISNRGWERPPLVFRDSSTNA